MAGFCRILESQRFDRFIVESEKLHCFIRDANGTLTAKIPGFREPQVRKMLFWWGRFCLMLSHLCSLKRARQNVGGNLPESDFVYENWGQLHAFKTFSSFEWKNFLTFCNLSPLKYGPLLWKESFFIACSSPPFVTDCLWTPRHHAPMSKTFQME